jgi:GNS1/SUR4 family
VESWPLMGSPAPLLLTFATYLLFVLSVGPRYMKDRKPMNLNFFTRGYNIFQVFACMYFINWAYNRGIDFSSTWKCLENRKDADERFDLDQSSWLFMMLRLIELIETVIFVLRKKQNQVSSLHIYHHLSTVVLLWSFLKYSPSELKILIKFDS